MGRIALLARAAGTAYLLLLPSLGCFSNGADVKPVEAQDAVSGIAWEKPPEPEWLNLEDFPSRVLECQLTAGDAGAEGGYRLFSVDRMTSKLQRYPGLADYAGLSLVSSCDEAVAFERAYIEYSDRNPGFEDGALPAQSTQRRVLPKLKISNGSQLFEGFKFPETPNPVVGLVTEEWTPKGVSTGKDYFCDPVKLCTGTFIAKHWILTAAHCLQNAHKPSIARFPPKGSAQCPAGGIPDPPQGGGDAGGKSYKYWEGYAPWIILWAPEQSPPQGDPNWPKEARYRYMLETAAYQFPHPNYLSKFPPGLEDANDMALIYIPAHTGYDRWLPPVVDQGAAARISANEGTDSDQKQYFIAGWGAYPQDASLPHVFRFGVAPAKKYRAWLDADLVAKLLPDFTGPLPCSGDSGGPFYRSPTFSTDVVVVGVHAGARQLLYPIPIPNDCPDPTTRDIAYWGRLEAKSKTSPKSDKLKWIEKTLSLFPVNSPFWCQGWQDEYTCWRDPCSPTRPCKAGYKCVGSSSDYENGRGPPSEMSLATACAPEICGDGTCKCVVGQCLPASDTVDAGRRD